MAVMGLALHLATGQAAEPDESAAWMASDEGKRFVSLSSVRWRDASIASSTDEDDAQAAADRTTAFYSNM